MENSIEKTKAIRNAVTAKILFILIMILLLMIPNFMIKNLIRERSNRKAEIEEQVAISYGGEQRLMTPMLKVPYTYTYDDSEGKPHKIKGTYTFTPDYVNINGDIQTDYRERSIYEVVVYNSHMKIEENFSHYQSMILEKGYTLDYSKAYFLLGITDANGLADENTITVAGKTIKIKGNAALRRKNMKWLESETFVLDPDLPLAVSSQLNFRGIKSLKIEAIGEKMDIHMTSPWQDPSFVGTKLPSTYDISEEGFQAKWKVNKFAHSYPDYWKNDKEALNSDYSFGVNLIQPVDEYGKNSRTSKYALLIISMTFGIFFFFETLFKKNIHPVQYILIGFALTIFFLLLLSITEHLGFDAAYILSSIATIGLIVSYASFILGTKRGTAILAGLLIGLFAYIFIILQMRDFALLAGTLALFVVLATVMVLSRKVDWYQLKKE